LSGGYDTVTKVAGSDAAVLAEKTTLSEKQAAKLIEQPRGSRPFKRRNP